MAEAFKDQTDSVHAQDFANLKKVIFGRFDTLKSQLEGMQKLASFTQKEAFAQIKAQSETIYQKSQ